MNTSADTSEPEVPTAPEIPGSRLLDPKFRENAGQYLIQCGMATAVIFGVLVLLNMFTQTVLIAALGATTFIAFTMPHVQSAQPRYLIGGYTMGVLAGVAVSSVLSGISLPLDANTPNYVYIGGAAIATGLAIFAMVLTDTEHPPAAGLALGFVLNPWDWKTVMVVMLGVTVISTFRAFYKSRMMNLL